MIKMKFALFCILAVYKKDDILYHTKYLVISATEK